VVKRERELQLSSTFILVFPGLKQVTNSYEANIKLAQQNEKAQLPLQRHIGRECIALDDVFLIILHKLRSKYMGKHMVKLALPCSNSRFNSSGTGREKKEKNGLHDPAYKYANLPVPNRLFSSCSLTCTLKAVFQSSHEAPRSSLRVLASN
jgi:hypothetical protein